MYQALPPRLHPPTHTHTHTHTLSFSDPVVPPTAVTHGDDPGVSGLYFSSPSLKQIRAWIDWMSIGKTLLGFLIFFAKIATTTTQISYSLHLTNLLHHPLQSHSTISHASNPQPQTFAVSALVSARVQERDAASAGLLELRRQW